MAPFKNELSWSVTRDKLFRDCLRKYYWNYYGSWNGWRTTSPDSARLAYRLKNMTRLPMWAGSVVHDTIESTLRAVRSGMRPTLDEAQGEARRRLNEGWFSSVEKKWRRDPKRSINLFEHYYGEGITKEQRLDLRQHVFNCLERFFAGAAYAKLREIGHEHWVALEDFDQFELMGVKVWVVLDVAIKDGDEIVIFDWKTGEPRDADAEQVSVYALFAMSKWQTPPEKLQTRLVYLKHDEERVARPDATALIDLRERVTTSIAAMRDLLVAPEDNEADIDDFPMIDDMAKCAQCEFKQLCERD